MLSIYNKLSQGNLVRLNGLQPDFRTYLPTPLHKQDVQQGQFLSRV